MRPSADEGLVCCGQGPAVGQCIDGLCGTEVGPASAGLLGSNPQQCSTRLGAVDVGARDQPTVSRDVNSDRLGGELPRLPSSGVVGRPTEAGDELVCRGACLALGNAPVGDGVGKSM